MTTRRIALGLEYDGTDFVGWQAQRAGRSVQAELETALSRVADHPVEVTAAGRTDAGVHAAGQVVHFDTGASRSERQWLLGANSNLPSDVAVRWVRVVPPSFHARYSATARTYRYSILTRLARPALARERVWWLHDALDPGRMQAAAVSLLGERDFSAFRAAACQAKRPWRHLSNVAIRVRGELVTVDVTANAFLHHMVRNLVGVLTRIGTGEAAIGWAREVLESRDRRQGGVTAPAAGLCFLSVTYASEDGLPTRPGSEPDPEMLYDPSLAARNGPER